MYKALHCEIIGDSMEQKVKGYNLYGFERKINETFYSSFQAVSFIF